MSNQLDPNTHPYPALWLEENFNLHNIGTYWTMPAKKPMKEVQNEIRTNILKSSRDNPVHLQDSWKLRDIFVSLNPELRAVHIDQDNHMAIRHFLHGVVSGFNTDDINYFINDWLYICDNQITRRTQDTLSYILEERIKEEYNRPSENSWYPQRLRSFFNASGSYANHVSYIQWIPSKKTISKIHKQIDQKCLNLSCQSI